MQRVKSKSIFRRFWDWLTGRRTHVYEVRRLPFKERCSNGDLAARFGRPNVLVKNLRRFP